MEITEGQALLMSTHCIKAGGKHYLSAEFRGAMKALREAHRVDTIPLVKLHIKVDPACKARAPVGFKVIKAEGGERDPAPDECAVVSMYLQAKEEFRDETVSGPYLKEKLKIGAIAVRTLLTNYRCALDGCRVTRWRNPGSNGNTGNNNRYRGAKKGKKGKKGKGKKRRY